MTHEPINTPAIHPPNPASSITRTIDRATASLVAVLALAAFALSFEALRNLSIESGVINRNVSWLYPLIVDGGIVVFSLAALRASLAGADSRWFMTLVVLVTSISIGFNIAHAGHGFLPASIAAMPPLLLFLAFESLMRQVRDTVLGVDARNNGKNKPHALKNKRPVVLSAVTVDEVAARRARALGLLAQGLSRNRIAKELNVTPSTVRRYLSDSKCA